MLTLSYNVCIPESDKQRCVGNELSLCDHETLWIVYGRVPHGNRCVWKVPLVQLLVSKIYYSTSEMSTVSWTCFYVERKIDLTRVDVHVYNY